MQAFYLSTWGSTSLQYGTTSYCVWGMRTPPLISVGCFVHYWVSHAIIKYFEVLAYVLPHFDAIIHMLIRGSSTFIFQTLRSAILSSWSIHLLQVCWIFLKRTYFKSLLKVYNWSVFAKYFKAFIFQKFRQPLCHKVNLPSCVAWQLLCHKVNIRDVKLRGAIAISSWLVILSAPDKWTF